MKSFSDYIKKAYELHMSVPVVDSHNDLAGEILIRKNNGESDIIQRLYLPHWKAAHFKLIVSSIYVENSVFYPHDPIDASIAEPLNWDTCYERQLLNWEQGFENARNQIEVLKEEINSCPDELLLVTSAKDMDILANTDKIGILMYMEGLDCIGTDLSKLDLLYHLGVRGASLTWSRRNLIATGCCTATRFDEKPGSITDYGMKILRHMNELGMFIDISHLNNDGFAKIFDSVKPNSPIIATHSNAFSVYQNYRNLTDSQAQLLASRGGIIGLNACKYIVGCTDISYSDSRRESVYLDAMCCHIEHLCNLTGPNHVGFGFDLCDSYRVGKLGYNMVADAICHAVNDKEGPFIPEDCLTNHKEALLLTARLLERGMAEENVLLIISHNWWNYFHSVVDKETLHP